MTGTLIRLKQSKGGVRVKVKVHATLKAALDAMPSKRADEFILLSSDGKPWTRWLPLVMGEGLPQGWRYRRTFDDLRGTFVSRSARHGGTPLEIADITGHGVDILDKHYLCRDGSLRLKR